MGASMEDAYAIRLQADIQIACNRLEEIGCESLVIVASGGNHISMGSKRGTNYLGNSTKFIEDFCQYCQADSEIDQDENHSVVKTPSKGEIKEEVKSSIEVKELDETEIAADDALFELKINDDEPLEDSDGDSVMSGVEEIGSEEKTNNKTTVIVLKAEPLEGVDGQHIAVVQDSKSKGSIVKTYSTKTATKSEFPRIFPCDRCKKVYKRNEDLKIHMRKHDGIFPFICAVCQKGFLSKKMLTMHEPVHSVSKPFACTKCSKQYTRKEDLTIHMRKHSGETPYKCEKCPEGFIGRKQLKTHKATVHGERPYKCQFCDREYARIEDMRSHQNQHTGARPYTCTECDQTFETRWQMREHRKHHFKQECHMCETCGKSFSRKHNLDRHKLLHTDNIVGRCEICNKEFRDASTLRKHELRHNGQKPFTCNYCAKQFWSKYLLVAHERLHTGEKPYECEQCGLKFVLKRYLTRHQLKVHQDMSDDLEPKIEDDQETLEAGIEGNQETFPIHHLGRAQRSIIAGNPGVGYTAGRNTIYQTHKDDEGNVVLLEVTNVVNSPDVLTEGLTVQRDQGIDTKQEVLLRDKLKGEGEEYSEMKEEGGCQKIILEELLKQAGSGVTIVLNK